MDNRITKQFNLACDSPQGYQSIPGADILVSEQPQLSADLQVIIELFEFHFFTTYNTRLQAGASEPIYLPAGGDCAWHRLFFREDYISSALHETAHWCIAGAERLKQQDFGYWYHPDGRTQEQQQVFEAAEVKPQALEWMFSLACGQHFSLSVDNLEGDSPGASESFAQAVSKQAIHWCLPGRLPSRAELFIRALSGRFGAQEVLNSQQYHRQNLK